MPTSRESELASLLEDRASNVSHRSESERERVLDKIALDVGTNYEDVKALLAQLSYSARQGSKASVGLAKLEPRIKDKIRTCASMLHSYAFISQLFYSRKSQTLHVTASPSPPEVQAFFTGGWFERFVWATTLMTLPLERSAALRNVKLELPRGGAAEIDIVAAIDGAPILIECRTGDYQDRIQRYVDRSAELGVPPDRNFLVVLDIALNVADDLSHLFGLRVLNQKGVAEGLRRLQ